MSELNPCPFCEGKVEIKSYPKWDEKQGIVYGAMIDHKNCSDGMETGLFFINSEKTEEEAREKLTRAWNTRAETEAEKKIEAIRSECERAITDAECALDENDFCDDFPEGRMKACRGILRILEGENEQH